MKNSKTRVKGSGHLIVGVKDGFFVLKKDRGGWQRVDYSDNKQDLIRMYPGADVGPVPPTVPACLLKI